MGKKVIYHFVRVGVTERLRDVLEFLGLTERLGRSDAGFMELLDLTRRIADLSQVFEGELPSDLLPVFLVAVHQRVPRVVDARLLELLRDLRTNLCDAPLALLLQFAHELVAHVLDNLLQADVACGELGLGLSADCLLRLLIGDPLLRRKTGLVLCRKEGLRRLSRHRLHHVLLGDEHGVEHRLHVVIERGPGDVLRHGVDVLKPAAVLSEGERELLGRRFTFEHVRLERAGELLMRRALILRLHGRPRLHVLDAKPGERVVHGLHIRLHVVGHVLVLHDVRRDLRAHVEEKMPRLVEKRGAIGAIPTGDGAKRRKVFAVDTVLSVAHDELAAVLFPQRLRRHIHLTCDVRHLRLDERLQVARLLLRHLERTDAGADDTPHLGELVSERFARRLRRLQLDGALNVLHLLHGEGAADRHEFEDGLVLLHHRLHLADRHLDRPARGERLRHLLRHLRNTRELLVEPPLVEGVRIELDRLNARSSRHFLLVSGGSLGIELVDSRLRFAQLLHGLGVSASTLFLAGNRGARLHTRGEDFDRRGELFAHHFRHDIRPRRDLAVGKELARGFAHAAHRALHGHLQGHVGELALVRRVEHLTRGRFRHHGDACQSDRRRVEERRRRSVLLCALDGIRQHVSLRGIKIGRGNRLRIGEVDACIRQVLEYARVFVHGVGESERARHLRGNAASPEDRQREESRRVLGKRTHTQVGKDRKRVFRQCAHHPREGVLRHHLLRRLGAGEERSVACETRCALGRLLDLLRDAGLHALFPHHESGEPHLTRLVFCSGKTVRHVLALRDLVFDLLDAAELLGVRLRIGNRTEERGCIAREAAAGEGVANRPPDRILLARIGRHCPDQLLTNAHGGEIVLDEIGKGGVGELLHEGRGFGVHRRPIDRPRLLGRLFCRRKRRRLFRCHVEDTRLAKPHSRLLRRLRVHERLLVVGLSLRRAILRNHALNEIHQLSPSSKPYIYVVWCPSQDGPVLPSPT